MKKWLSRLGTMTLAVIALGCFAYTGRLDAANREVLHSLLPDVQRGDMIRLAEAEGPRYILFEEFAHSAWGEGLRAGMGQSGSRGFYTADELLDLQATKVSSEAEFREGAAKMVRSLYNK